VVRRLVELHGGTAEAASAGEGRGATFAVNLPAMDTPERSEPRPEPARHPLPSGLRVLVVEDNDDAREMMHALLALHGHDVQVAENGVVGLAAAELFHPDVVLLDIGLPDIDGYEIARRLRGRDPERAMRLVALTGYGQSEDEAAAYSAGFDLHLTKPVEPDALARMLAELDPARREAVPGD
jgi:two-component system CheB/CheR fusion protein